MFKLDIVIVFTELSYKSGLGFTKLSKELS